MVSQFSALVNTYSEEEMITIVFGKPGMGKTAYLTADAVEYMRSSPAQNDLLRGCRDQVAALNAAGANFALPMTAPVYSNYPITVGRGTLPPVSSYYIDGFRLGFPNDDLRTLSVLPGARIYLSEAQRYYNSRRSKDLPDWVSRYYEEHRHFGLEIYLDVQRPGLIDANIREIAGVWWRLSDWNTRQTLPAEYSRLFFIYGDSRTGNLLTDILRPAKSAISRKRKYSPATSFRIIRAAVITISLFPVQMRNLRF